jgi:tellurite resistance protein
MPTSCACCGLPADTFQQATSTRVEGKRVIRTKTSTWQFPYCSACNRHDEAWPAASAATVFWLTLLTCGLYLIYYIRQRNIALALCSPLCGRPVSAVSYSGWHGSVHYFDLASPSFTREFLVANASKVVDLDPQARALLNAPAMPVAAPAPARARPPAAPAAPANVSNRPSGPPAGPRASGGRSVDANLIFVGPGDLLEVAGRTLRSSLTYVTAIATPEASAIVTTLPVGTSSAASPLPYWPSYSGASPHQRAVYLDWLVAGRGDPLLPIGYVFVYFYGLERRALVDRADHDIIRVELRRLLGIYGDNRSFRSYAANLLAFMLLPDLSRMSEADVRAELAATASENPATLAGLLAWFHVQARPLPAEYAMLVAKSMENAKRGVVVQRAYTELSQLFAIRYRERFGDGLRLQAAKRPQEFDYHAASPSLIAAARQIHVKVPHVLGRLAQFNDVVDLWNDCVDSLKKVSFAKRADHKAPLTAEAWAALPAELRAEYDHPDRDRWDDLVRGASPLGSFKLVTAGQLAALAGTKVGARVTAVQLRRAVETAALLEYAVEPDARVSAKSMQASNELLIWRTSDPRPLDATLWSSAHTMLSMTLAVALADGALADEEARTVASLVEELFVLDDAMRVRVEALRHLLARQPGRVTTIARALQASRTADDLKKVGRVLVAVAGADGTITDGEHKSLRSLYKALGLAPSDLAAAIVASGAGLDSDAPVQVQAASPDRPGEAIPAAPEAPRGHLNSEAIAAILAETREVAQMLSTVLDTDDADEAGEAPVSAATTPVEPKPTGGGISDGPIRHLDIRYQAVLEELLSKTSWTAAEIRAVATRSKLMPGAILETINSWSDEHLGDYLIEELGDWHIKTNLVRRATA